MVQLKKNSTRIKIKLTNNLNSKMEPTQNNSLSIVSNYKIRVKPIGMLSNLCYIFVECHKIAFNFDLYMVEKDFYINL